MKTRKLGLFVLLAGITVFAGCKGAGDGPAAASAACASADRCGCISTESVKNAAGDVIATYPKNSCGQVGLITTAAGYTLAPAPGGMNIVKVGQTQASGFVLTGTAVVPRFDIELDDGATVVYKESTGFGVLQAIISRTYNMKLNSNNGSVSLQLKTLGGAPIGAAMTLNLGNNVFVAPATVGNYRFTITSGSGDLMVSRDYDFATTCDDTDSGPFPINANAIAVSGSAIYTYNASGVPPSMVGHTFDCAWDFNGDGIRDSQFASCGTAVQQFSNHINNRNITVWVRDNLCNKVQVAQAIRTLADPNPPATEVYIRGNIVDATSPATGDPRLTVDHVSVNRNFTGGSQAQYRNDNGLISKPATCNYSRGSNGKGSLTMNGLYRYNALSTSRVHGLTVSYQNIDDAIVVTAGGASGTLSGTNATIKGVEFKSDEAPDIRTYIDFAGGPQCTGTLTIRAENVAGFPCSGGQSGSTLSFSVFADAQFTCSGLPDTFGTSRRVNIEQGSFHCEFAYADSCSGGGGGGGGIVPIYF